MGLYEEKLHEFIIQPENFDLAWEIYEAIPDVRDRLKVDVLNDFEPYAAERAVSMGWEAYGLDRTRVQFGKPEWERMFAATLYLGSRSLPAVGLWHDKQHPSLKGQREDLVKRTKEAASAIKGKMDNGTNSLWYCRIGTNFATLAEIKSLLPDNREDLLEHYWAMLLEIAKGFESSVDMIVGEIKGKSE